jgi:Domain of unknown function (DUF4234)
MSVPYQPHEPAPSAVTLRPREGKIRDPLGVWLLSIVTLGIYYLVWWYKINREVGEFDPTIRVSPGVAVVAITVGGLIVVPPFVSTVMTGVRISQVQRAAGLEPSCSGLLGVLLWLLFGLNTIYYQAELNKVWKRSGPERVQPA